MRFSDAQQRHIDDLVQRRLIADRRRRGQHLDRLEQERDRLRIEVGLLRTALDQATAHTHHDRSSGVGARLRRLLHWRTRP